MTVILRRRGCLGWLAACALSPREGLACEYQAATLRILHPWTRATAPGQADAIVGMTFDEVARDDRLIGVSTPVAARAVLIDRDGPADVDLPIPAGQVTTLDEQGVTLRLQELRHALEVGRSYPLRLLFAEGGPVVATLNVDYARFR